MSLPFVPRLFQVVQQTRTSWLTEVMDLSRLGRAAINMADHDAFHARFCPDDASTTEPFNSFSHPHCMYEFPVFKVPADVNSPLVGLIHGVLPWDYYLLNLLP